MPHPIPEERVLERALKFISKRQLKKRPTTLRELGNTIGIGTARLRVLFEKEHIEYVLVPHTNNLYNGFIEILLISIPERIAEDYRLDNEALYKAYQEMIGDTKPKEPVYPYPDGDVEMSLEEAIDPYAPYRISKEYFETIKENLITFDELVARAKKKGYSRLAIRRATGGWNMRYILPSDYWRPYIVSPANTRYYDKRVLRHLSEVFKLFESEESGEKARRQWGRATGELQYPNIFIDIPPMLTVGKVGWDAEDPVWETQAVNNLLETLQKTT